MLVVVERSRLVKMLDLTRDDKGKRGKTKVEDIPYLRFAANDNNTLTLTGLRLEAEFPATVHEPGVFFIRAAMFRHMIAMLKGDPVLTIQAGPEEIAFADVRLKYTKADVLVYPDAKTAPLHHPGDRQRAAEADREAVAAARERVAVAKDRIIMAAEAMIEAEKELGELLGTKPDVRKTLADLLADVKPDKRAKKARKR